MGRSCFVIVLINLLSNRHPNMAPSKLGTIASADCDGRAAEINPPKIPTLAMMLMPAIRLYRASCPAKSARHEIVSSIPIFRTALSFVPNACIAMFFSHFGVWSMNSLPTAFRGVTTSSNTAIRVPMQTAKKDEIRPATGAVQFGAGIFCFCGADGSVSG